jgi:hypothetical protein
MTFREVGGPIPYEAARFIVKHSAPRLSAVKVVLRCVVRSVFLFFVRNSIRVYE